MYDSAIQSMPLGMCERTRKAGWKPWKGLVKLAHLLLVLHLNATVLLLRRGTEIQNCLFTETLSTLIHFYTFLIREIPPQMKKRQRELLNVEQAIWFAI